jgi:hypothetical protein
LERCLRPVGHHVKQRARKLTSHGGVDLGDLLDGGEAIEADKQGIVECCWDGERRQRSGKLVAIGRVLKKAVSSTSWSVPQQKRHAVGLSYNLRADVGRQGL